MLTANFWHSVATLRRPEMGTEVMGPLLYQLVRFSRPRTVLEVGMGFTSPFLAQALADNHSDNLAELQSLASKTERLLERTAQLTSAEEVQQAQLDWLLADRTFGNPLFYQRALKPVLVAIDTLTHPSTSAPAVQAQLEQLGLGDFVTIINSDFRRASEKLDPALLPIDFAWFDVGGKREYEEFFMEYWPFINEQGGTLVFHNTVNNPGPAAFISSLKQRQILQPTDLEILSLLEPHKLTQNSCTVVRRISGIRETAYLHDASLRGELEKSAVELVQQRRRSRDSAQTQT